MTTEREDQSVAMTGRRPELDGIRLLVVVGLVFFHAALVFDAQVDFYVTNADTTEVTTILAGMAVVWAMPVLFLIAGFGSWHSLMRRGPGGFAMERLLRLGVPLVFVTIVLTPVPQWLRLRAEGGYEESYLDFLRRFFDIQLEPSQFPFILQGEHFETGHLWFVLLLLTFSLFLALVAARVSGERVARIRDRLAKAAQRRGAVLLPAIPVAAVCAVHGLEEGYAAWSRWAYLLFFLYGLVLATDDRFRAAMRRNAVSAAVLGLGLFGLGMSGFLAVDEPFTDMTAPAIGIRALYGVAGWCWLVAILGLLDRPRAAVPVQGPQEPKRHRLYRYMAAAALPFYLLHQPILVVVAYHVIRWDASIVAKYAVIVATSLALTVATYDVLVRRTRVTRFLFGMREPT